MNIIVTFSIWLGVNKIDWLRTVYFSLFGSSALTYAMKLKSFENLPSILFGLGVLFFLIGLLSSMRISDSFKKYEFEYTTLEEAKKIQYGGVKNYILDMESNYFYSFQHFLIYALFWVAIGVIGVSSFKTETILLEKSDKIHKESEQRNALILKSEQALIKSMEANNLLILELKINNQQLIDSLNKLSNRKSGSCQIQGKDKNNGNQK